MPRHELTLTLPSDREIVIERFFDAPRAAVYEAMTTPALVRRWWGPRGTTLPVCEIDLRPGGAWRFVIEGPDGTRHPFKGVYREIVPAERVVQTWIYDVAPINQFEAVETMTLEDRDNGTLLRTVALHASKQARDGHIQSGMERGAAETMDRLEELLDERKDA